MVHCQTQNLSKRDLYRADRLSLTHLFRLQSRRLLRTSSQRSKRWKSASPKAEPTRTAPNADLSTSTKAGRWLLRDHFRCRTVTRSRFSYFDPNFPPESVRPQKRRSKNPARCSSVLALHRVLVKRISAPTIAGTSISTAPNSFVPRVISLTFGLHHRRQTAFTIKLTSATIQERVRAEDDSFLHWPLQTGQPT